MRAIAISFLVGAVLAGSPPARPQAAPSTAASKSPHAKISAGLSTPAEPESSTKTDSPSAKLPVRRVVLYKTGVGYFEHVGHVNGDQSVQIDFTTSQLNDVLQSLTVLDLGGGRIVGVNYNSEAPLSQRLGLLRIPLGEKTDLSKFYAALRGARLEVRSGTTEITGRLLSVERKTRVSGGTTLEVDLATIVTDTGEVRSVEITPAVSVRMAERDVTQEVGAYLSLLASMRQEDLRRMTVATAGSGNRELYVSYISEVPVWKTTYRIVLDPKSEPLLQGWAIVDNTVGEDWNNVELSLVAGAPQSFIQQLSQPYYTRRPVVALPENAQLTPQTHENSMSGGFAALSGTINDQSGAAIPGAQIRVFSPTGEIAATATSDNEGAYHIPELPTARYRIEFSSPGFRTTVMQDVSLSRGQELAQNVTLNVGSTAETVTVTAASPTLQTDSANVGEPTASRNVGSGRALGFVRSLGNTARGGNAGGTGGGVYTAANIAEARRAVSAAAEGADLGDYFEYKLKDRVTIHKNESSLVPVLQTHIGVEKVSLWNASLNSERPLRALWLTNSSPLTLDGGNFSIFENETFAGEGLTEAIKPAEKRLVSYAQDLGIRVTSRSDSQPESLTRVRISRGLMLQTSELRQETTYIIRNDDTTPRTVLIEHPLRTDWKLAEGFEQPDETTSSAYRFRETVDAKATTKLTVKEVRPIENRYQLTNLTDAQLEIFVQRKTIDPQIEAALRKIVDQKNAVAALDTEISARDDETQKIYDDQQRLRENLKALKGSSEERALTQRYTQQLSDQETRLTTIQTERANLQTQLNAAQAQLDSMIQNLTMEGNL